MDKYDQNTLYECVKSSKNEKYFQWIKVGMQKVLQAHVVIISCLEHKTEKNAGMFRDQVAKSTKGMDTELASGLSSRLRLCCQKLYLGERQPAGNKCKDYKEKRVRESHGQVILWEDSHEDGAKMNA